MTTNKTTALIERIISHNINVKDINTNERISCKFDAHICAEKIQEALAAFEQPAVRDGGKHEKA